MNTSSDNKKFIQDIANRLNDGNMSFIIGAGFSKNISPKFLSWKELLHDMIVEMYEEERQTWHATDDELIAKYGYLGIASDYVRRKGYHEAIDHYIEERTPVLNKKKDGKVEMYLNGVCIDNNVDVSTHYLLLNLGARYIYTFNYDNALEYNGDRVETESDRDKLSKVTKEIKDLVGFINEYKEKAQQIIDFSNDQSHNVASTENDMASLIEELNSKLNIGSLILEKHNLNSILQNIHNNRQSLQKYKSEKESEKNSIESSVSHKYTIIKSSKEIINSSQQHCIFKLHGSLRNSDDYGFDENHHLQYIICQEDYDSYVEKHEAFVDLMRISLLRESFCIIGFSCDDPNFLLWVNWVKDVNDKSHDNKTQPLPKYYINVDDNDLPVDKLQMLEHHGISIIDLKSLYDGTEKLTRKERLLKFLIDVRKYKDASNIWKYVRIKRNYLDLENMEVECDHDLIDDKWERMCSFPYPTITKRWDDYTRDDVMRKELYNLEHNCIRDYELKLLMLAINDSNLSSYIVADKDKDTFDKYLGYYKEVREWFADLDLVSTHLVSTHLREKNCEYEQYTTKDTKRYVEILDLLLSFKFDDAFSKLELWSPSNSYQKLIRMLLLIELYDKDFSNNDVWNIANPIIKSTDKQYVYTSLELILVTRPSNTYSEDPGQIYNAIFEHKKKLSAKSKGLVNFNDYVRSLHNEGFPDRKVEPLGNVVNEIGFAYDRRIKPSNQLIMMMAKGGLIPFANGQEIIRKDYWFDFVSAAYYKYPSYCLFGSALYGDKNLIERIAQLYTFSPMPPVQEFIRTKIPEILKSTLNEHITQKIRNNLFFFAEYFVRVVPHTEWLHEYRKLFDANDWINPSKEEGFYKEERKFAEDALEFILDEDYCNEIISRCLSYGKNITNYQNRLIISAYKDIKHLSKENLEVLNSWMQSDITEIQSFVIFNLHSFIDDRKYQDWLRNLSDDILNSDISLEAVCAYIKDPDEKIRCRLSKYVANSKALWANGIRSKKESTISFNRSRALNIDEIEDNFSLLDEDVITIFNKLKLSFDQIKPLCQKNSIEYTLNNWDSLLRSMLRFLILHKQVLQGEQDYHHYYELCIKVFNDIREDKSITERITSEDSSEVEKAVTDLYYAATTLGIENYAFEYQMLANVIIQKSTKALEFCLNHFSWFIGVHEEFFINNGFIKPVKLILDTFEPYFFNDITEWTLEADKDNVERNMILLFHWLVKNDKDIDKDEKIMKWKTYQPFYTLTKMEDNV